MASDGSRRSRHSVRQEGVSDSKTAWWVYLLGCEDGRTYAGIALDVAERFDVHASGKGAKFTRANPPISILGTQSYATRSEALKAEYALKQLSREARLDWARVNPPTWTPNRQAR